MTIEQKYKVPNLKFVIVFNWCYLQCSPERIDAIYRISKT